MDGIECNTKAVALRLSFVGNAHDSTCTAQPDRLHQHSFRWKVQQKVQPGSRRRLDAHPAEHPTRADVFARAGRLLLVVIVESKADQLLYCEARHTPSLPAMKGGVHAGPWYSLARIDESD